MFSSGAQNGKRKKRQVEVANAYDDDDDNENIDTTSSSDDDENVYNACDNVCDDENIDYALQKLIEMDTDHWKGVSVRIISVVKFLARNASAFRGTNEKLYQESGERFLGTVRMVAEFDVVVQSHFWRVRDEKTHCDYLRDVVQNELIETLASNVKNEIVKKIKRAKYFSLILDCSLDASYEEQMTLIIRYVDVSDSPIQVEEVFLDFLVVEEDTSGVGLFNVLHDVLRSLDLDIKWLRGQGYANGFNMKGKHQGVQKRLLDISPKAFYMPCGCYSLNLVLCDMANSCHKAKIFFGTCQTICDVFSDSTKRWTVVLEYVDDLTLRSLSTTCCESHIESVKAIKTQLVQIQEALMQLAQVCDDGKVYRDVESLLYGELSSFDFIVSLVIWHEILDKIDLVSKKLQSKDMLLDVVVQNLEGLLVYFEKYRENGFDCAIAEAKEIADKIGVEPKFVVKRSFSWKKQFDEIPNIEREQKSAQEMFKTDYFLVLVDMTLSQLRTRFEQMKEFESTFGFLFDGRKLVTLQDEDLKRCCMNLEVVLTNGDYCDIEGQCLFVELQVLQVALREQASEKENPWTYIQIMEYANKMGMFPYVMIAYRILLTSPVTVASTERSSSKLELSKSYLRSTTSQERSNGLATLCMESKFLADVNYKQVIDTLASKNAQRYRFR